MLSLLYYTGYLTMIVCYFYPMILSVLISGKANDRFKIPNLEVTMDWARWTIGDVESSRDILKTCVEGPVSDFTAKWPNFMQERLDPKLAGLKAPDGVTRNRIYRTLFLGLMHSLRAKGWEVSIEPRAGAGYGIRLCNTRNHVAILMELKSSEKQQHMKRDANNALKQIERNYRNSEGLPNICTLREYGIAHFQLSSYVEGRYLELNHQNHWVEKEDPRNTRIL